MTSTTVSTAYGTRRKRREFSRKSARPTRPRFPRPRSARHKAREGFMTSPPSSGRPTACTPFPQAGPSSLPSPFTSATRPSLIPVPIPRPCPKTTDRPVWRCSDGLRELAPHAQLVLQSGWVDEKNKKIFNNKQISDHFAIIPTNTPPRSLDANELKIYNLILKRFISVFYPPAQWDVTTRQQPRRTPVQDRGPGTGRAFLAAIYGKDNQPEDTLPPLLPEDNESASRSTSSSMRTRPSHLRATVRRPSSRPWKGPASSLTTRTWPRRSRKRVSAPQPREPRPSSTSSRKNTSAGKERNCTLPSRRKTFFISSRRPERTCSPAQA